MCMLHWCLSWSISVYVCFYLDIYIYIYIYMYIYIYISIVLVQNNIDFMIPTCYKFGDHTIECSMIWKRSWYRNSAGVLDIDFLEPDLRNTNKLLPGEYMILFIIFMYIFSHIRSI